MRQSQMSVWLLDKTIVFRSGWLPAACMEHIGFSGFSGFTVCADTEAELNSSLTFDLRNPNNTFPSLCDLLTLCSHQGCKLKSQLLCPSYGMDGWLDGWVDGCMDGWVDEWMEG